MLLDGDALLLHRIRQGRERSRHAVLHQHLREIEIRADLEGHDERVGPVRRADRLHVDHVLDAVDLLLDRQRNGVDHCARACARIAGRHLDGRRCHVRILRDRQREQRHAANNDHQDRQNVREDRPLDEVFGDHFAAAVCVFGSTFCPGIARSVPETTTRSSGFNPVSITVMSPTIGPISTLRCSTVFSPLTVST